jgi:basic membrane protein A and related proteins
VRRALLAVALPAAALSVVVAACGSSKSASSAGTKGGGVPVAILSTGAINNRSWANSWYNGATREGKALGVKVTVVGNVETPDQYLSEGASFASQGYKVIIFAHGAMDAPAQKLAKQFPNVQWIQAPFEFATPAPQQKEPPNLGHVDVKQEQGAFLAGALAGLVTKTNKVSAVYAFPFPALTRQPEAFELGAKCSNPKVSFTQKQTGSFTDAALARAAASSEIAGGSDVVFAAVDQAVQGVIAAAQSAPHKSYVVASYFNDASLGPNVVLTSVLYNLDGVAANLVQMAQQNKGNFGPHFFKSYALADFGVGKLAPFMSGAVSSSAQAKFNAIQQKVLSGQIKVPDAVTGSPTIGTVGSGAKVSPSSIGC